jgi:hypothetical protein
MKYEEGSDASVHHGVVPVESAPASSLVTCLQTTHSEEVAEQSAARAAAPVETLSERSGRPLAALKEARRRTAERMAARVALTNAIEADTDVSIVLMGSWGRAELTSGSDDDFMVLVHGDDREVVRPSVEAVAESFAKDPGSFKDPGRDGVFERAVFSQQLRANLGLDADSKANLTRRLVLLLESVAVFGQEAYDAVRGELLEEYLKDASRDYRPPGLFVNDITRWWALGVDFVAKTDPSEPLGWALRNAKLATSRKLLYASGLIPVLRCHELMRAEMVPFLEEQLRMPPTDRLADAFLHYGELEHGAQVLDAYDRYLQLIDDEEARRHLNSLGPDEARESRVFQFAAELGSEIHAGLCGLLVGPALSRWTKELAVL